MLTFSTTRTVTASGPALPLSATGDPALQLSAIDGNEFLSRIYGYTLDFLTPPDLLMPESEAANLDLKAMIGKELTITVQLDGMGSSVPGMAGLSGVANIGQGTREFSGIVTEARFAGQRNRQSHYQLVMRPWIHLADQRSDYRIFQNKTVVEIIDEVLQAYSYSRDKRLSAQYPELIYQVQYGETDFAFIQRLMQENGIYWFFEHSNKVHRMVLVDQLGAHKPVESAAYQTLSYYPPGHKIDTEYIDTFGATESVQSGRWTTSDFNFQKPRADLVAENALPQDTAHNQLERYEWPGDYTDPVQGERFAKVRMEEMRACGERASGSGNVRDIVCGTTFRLKGYPQDDANREYLVIGAWFSATESGESTGSGEYRIGTSFVVQPATVVFRPPRDVPKPRTRGPQTAIVTGPDGQEIWTDQYGRVKLKFHWDRSSVRDQRSSCWVRVSYPWAGNNYGTISIPRVGSEVIVDFENGDPDRPIVTGRVYNALNMPPWGLPDSATQSGTLTRSMKGGYSTANAIRFEDKKGQEEVWIHAEKDMRTEVENDENHSVQANRTKSVTGNETTTVKGTRTETVTGDESITLQANRTRSVAQNDTTTIDGNRTTTVTGNQELTVKTNRTTAVNGDDKFTLDGNRVATVLGTETETVQQNRMSTFNADHTLHVSGHQSVKIGTGQNIHVTGDISVIATQKLSLVCGKSSVVMDSGGNIQITGVTITSTGTERHAINGGTLSSSATVENTVEGPVLKLNP